MGRFGGRGLSCEQFPVIALILEKFKKNRNLKFLMGGYIQATVCAGKESPD